MSSKRQGLRAQRSPFFWLAFTALGLVWGSSWIASDALAESVPPLRASALRFLLAALLCLPVFLLKRARLPRGRALVATLVVPVTLVVLPTVLLGWLRPQLPSATVTVLFAAMPLLLALGAPQAAMQASIVAVGAIAIAMGAAFSWPQAAAAALVLMVVALIGGSSLGIRRELSGENPLVVAALLLGTAGGLLLVASLVLEHDPFVWNREAILSLVFLGAVAGAGAYAMYVWLLQRMEAHQVATLQWVEPLVAVLESALVLRLRPTFSMIAGSVVTLVCLLVVMRARPEDDDTVSLLGN